MRKRIVVLMLVAALSMVACNGRALGPSAPCQVTISSQAANRVIQRAAQQGLVRGKPITVTATNEEASSLLMEYLSEAKKQNPNDFIPIDNPIVCFQDGKAQLFGTVQWGANNPLDALIALRATLKNGKPTVTIEQIQLGPVAVPPDLSDELTRMINRMVAQYLGPVTVSEITMQSGKITLTGLVR